MAQGQKHVGSGHNPLQHAAGCSGLVWWDSTAVTCNMQLAGTTAKPDTCGGQFT